jgi:hypothetical protein
LAKHYRLAVISNANGTIPDVLACCGIADSFESITDSGIVGKAIKAFPVESLDKSESCLIQGASGSKTQ